MAMSFSRPDPSSPAQVADATFSTQRRGFDQSEVRDFLRMVSAELGRLHERERFLDRELVTARSNPDFDEVKLDDEALTRLLGEETARVLTAARASAQEIREKAEQSAARLLSDASDEASRLREEAELEASRRRADAASDADAEISMAKQQGREMVEEARAYRERVLSELARRRELAREQIEQLIHGRDRLMASFERARLVAVDVVSELQPLGEPDEYVNLQPSTGPVPVMVARDDLRRDDTPSDQPDDALASTAEEASGADDSTAIDGDTATDAAPFDDTADDLRIIAERVGDATSAAPESETDDAVIERAADELVDAETETDADADVAADVEQDKADADAALETATDESPASTGGAEDLAVEDLAVEDLAADDSAADDDVVVDLFARLRADNDVAPEVASGEEPDAVTATVIGSDSVDADVVALVDDASGASDDDASDDVEEASGDTAFTRRDAELTPLIVASARKLKRVLADEQNEVLDSLRRSDPVRNLDGLLPWTSHHAERYASAIADELLAAAQAGAASHDEAAPGESTSQRARRLRPAAGRDAVEHASRAVVGALVEPLRDRIDRCIADGDGDNQAITKKVRAVYREWKTQRIDEVLDDVVRTAHGRGALAAVDLDRPVLWTVDPEAPCCSDCDDNALAGAVAAGQPFPTGHVCAPAHPGCRCMLLPGKG
ncbi:MAG: DivIVA domain-containing protein [Ilumatobacter sp.]